MKKPYEKPVIVKLQMGFVSKAGMSALDKLVRAEIDGVSVDELVERFGSPLFVFSERRILDRIKYAKAVFEGYYPHVEFSWSYKTNYLDAICAIFHRQGFTAEVVSDFEYEKAKRLGVPGDKIIFNGPFKPKSVLERAVSEGARVNIDSFEEIALLEEIAGNMGKTVSVGIRINMDTGVRPQWQRFGFNLESGQAMDAVKRIAAGGKLTISGLHCHQGTFILDADAYRIEVEKMLSFAAELERTFGFEIEYIDIGGGFPSKSRLKGVYLPTDVVVPSLKEYAERIGMAFISRMEKPHSPYRLVIESGRALIDEAGFLVATVLSVKRLPDGTRAYVIDAGVNLLYTSYWYHFNVEVSRAVSGTFEPSVIYGPLCMNIDVIEESVMLPPLNPGDKLILSPVGAYNVTQWMQFITYRPSVVLIREDGRVDVIRERESLNDIVARERLPEDLKL
ncbi:MAG: diaminopimelate decarboxylase [Deferribacteres bacterium]|nr:diaminopimelate decarboxylase [Deferribacteres bacterium]